MHIELVCIFFVSVCCFLFFTLHGRFCCTFCMFRMYLFTLSVMQCRSLSVQYDSSFAVTGCCDVVCQLFGDGHVWLCTCCVSR